jgi:fucose permease
MSLLSDEQGTSPFVMSLHMAAFSAGSLPPGLYLSRVTARIGRANALRIAGFGMASMILILVMSQAVALTLTAAFITGVFATVVVTMNTSFLDQLHHHAAPVAISEANSFAAFGGLISPLAIGFFVNQQWGWRVGLVIAVLLLILIEIFRGPREVFNVSRVEEKVEHGTKRLPTNYWWAWGLLVTGAGAEFSIMLWSTDLLRERAGLGDAAAVASLSTLTAGLLIGRIVTGKLAQKFAPEKLLRTAYVLPILIFSVLWLSTNPAVMLSALFAIGLSIAAHWPLGIGRAVRAGGDQPDLASARSAFATGGSGMVLPVLLGAIAGVVGVHTAFLLVPVILLCGLGLLIFKPLN